MVRSSVATATVMVVMEKVEMLDIANRVESRMSLRKHKNSEYSTNKATD